MMKILRLEVKGFRSLKNISWEPGDLNIVIGPNASGKSNLLRMLELIAVCARRGLGKYVQQAGGMGSLVWDGSAENISFSIETPSVEENNDINENHLNYQVKMSRLGKTSSFKITDEILEKYKNNDSTSDVLLNRDGLSAYYKDKHGDIKLIPEAVLEEEEPVLHAFSPSNKFHEIINPFQSQLESLCIYHNLRVDEESTIRQAVVTRHEERVEPDGQNLISVLNTLYTNDRDFKNEINSAMRAAFGEDFEELVFPPASDQRIQLRLRWKSSSRDVSAADLSDGTLRFLMLLTILASPKPPTLIAIDEPETGLHPSMFPIVAEYAVEASQRTQVIFTTHSPEFLNAFRDTIPAVTVAKWVDGETILEIKNGDELDKWLEEYTLGELFKSGELEDMD